MKTIKIKNRIIGEGFPAYIIAEMSTNHAGSLDNAKLIIRKAKESGADCIKIQTYTPNTLTIDCDNECFKIKNGQWKGEILYNLYGKAYTPWEWQSELMVEAERVGIDFFPLRLIIQPLIFWKALELSSTKSHHLNWLTYL